MTRTTKAATALFVLGLAITASTAWQMHSAEVAVERNNAGAAAVHQALKPHEALPKPDTFDATPYYWSFGVAGAALLGAFFLLGIGRSGSH